MADYMRTTEHKIVRCKHRITIHAHSTAGAVMAALAKVPPDAVIDEVCHDVDDNDFPAFVTFHEERPSEWRT